MLSITQHRLFQHAKIRYQKPILRYKKKIREGTKRTQVGKMGSCDSLEFNKQINFRETKKAIGMGLA